MMCLAVLVKTKLFVGVAQSKPPLGRFYFVLAAKETFLSQVSRD